MVRRIALGTLVVMLLAGCFLPTGDGASVPGVDPGVDTVLLGGIAGTEGGANPPVEELSIVPTALSGTSWTATVDEPWLSLTPSSGTIGDTAFPLSIATDTSTLATGSYTATITLAIESLVPLEIPVTLDLTGLPALYWTFDADTVTTDASVTVADLVDTSGGHDGTAVGSVDFTAAGVSGESATFPGLADTYLTTNEAGTADLKSQAFTVSVWMKPQAFPASDGSYVAVNLGNGTDSYTGAGLGAAVDAKARFFVEGPEGAATEITLESSPGVPTDDWTHVALVFESTGSSTGLLRIYENGALAEETTLSFGSVEWGTRPLELGRHSYYTSYDFRAYPGSLDELAWFAERLPHGAIRGLYRLGAEGRGLLGP